MKLINKIFLGTVFVVSVILITQSNDNGKSSKKILLKEDIVKQTDSESRDQKTQKEELIKSTTKVQEAQKILTDVDNHPSDPISPSDNKSRSVVPENVPESLLKALGGMAQQTWESLSSMSLDEAKKSSSVISFTKKISTTSAPREDVSQKINSETEDEEKNDNLIHWGEKKGCKINNDQKLSGMGPKERPPQCVGFFARTYDEYHNLLKQTFVPGDEKDISCCGHYQIELQDLLPKEIKAENFNGLLTLTTAMGQQRVESQEVWLNLAKPKGLGTSIKN